MLVFISWSGDKSNKVALELKEFIKLTLQGVKPWISEDIEKGTRWSEAISDKLEESKFGIACLTQDNLNSEWLNFESGAIAKNKKSNLWTFLTDVEFKNIKGPLSQFQHTISTDRDDVLTLIKTIRNKLKESGNDSAPEDHELEQYFEKFWDDFYNDLEKINKELPHKKEKPRSLEDITEEILVIVRRLENRINSNTEQEDMYLMLNQILNYTKPKSRSNNIEEYYKQNQPISSVAAYFDSLKSSIAESILKEIEDQKAQTHSEDIESNRNDK